VIPVLRIVDPAFVAPLLQAPGIHSRIPTIGFFSVPYLSSLYPRIDQAEQQMGLNLTVAMSLWLTCWVTLDKVLSLSCCYNLSCEW
jgi:hypothetical protein